MSPIHNQISNVVPFEIHITVAEAQRYDFTRCCNAIGVKPIFLHLQSMTDGPLRDVMTSSSIRGSNSDALAETKRISERLRDCGYEVIREKIETVPWHPAAPSAENGVHDMPKNCYFEAHIPVNVTQARWYDLMDYCQSNRAFTVHLSSNALKVNPDGTNVVMITFRKYYGYGSHFIKNVNHIIDSLIDSGFSVGDKVDTEFAIYDTKVSHDNKWMRR